MSLIRIDYENARAQARTTADSILICTGTTSLPFAASAGTRPA